MRVLTSSVLIMEAIVLLLAIPVAVVAGGQPSWVGWLFAVLALACAVLPGMYSGVRSSSRWAGASRLWSSPAASSSAG